MEIDHNEIMEDLGKLALLLNQYGICKTTDTFYKIQNEIRVRCSDNIVWDYGNNSEADYDFINFSIPKMAHTRPSDVDDISISLSVKSKGKKSQVVQTNHFEKLSLQLIIQAYAIDNSYVEKNVKSAWHMDMDTDPNNDFTHPLFHINFGGKELEDEIDTGDILLMRSPRLMHLPLDIFLGVDFVIQNFIGRKHDIYQDFDYQRIIKKYKYLHWKPYALAFADNFYDLGDSLKIDKDFAKNILGG